MRFSRTSVALLLAATSSAVVSVTSSSASAVSSPLSSVASFGLEKRNKSSLFGVSTLQQNGRDIISSIARGGAVATAEEEGADEDAEDKPQVLYLPGLLETVVAKRTVGSVLILVFCSLLVSALIDSKMKKNCQFQSLSNVHVHYLLFSHCMSLLFFLH